MKLPKINIYSCEPFIEYPPIFYVDYLFNKASLKRNWRSHNYFHFMIGNNRKQIVLSIEWNFIERERTPEEDEQYQKIKRIFGE